MDIPRLHPDTVEQVKQRVDIVDIVSEHVVLRKRGKDFTGLCPFHDDKSPSFSVSPGKQFYYCFSCGAGGNAITFLMEIGKRSFGDVVLDLAKRYQIPVKTLEPEQRQELQRKLSLRDQLYEILAIAARFYEHALLQPPGQAALDYLHKTRQFSDRTLQQFQLGYAPAGWQTLYGYLVEQKHYPAELVEKAGLIVPRQEKDGYYDRFRDRLMIPIHDGQGRVIGFGGRALGDAQPKYLNSPETELFDKGQTLFALDKAKAAIAKRDQAVVVEGYFDVIALHAAGIENAVASLGTALSLAQIRQLLRYSESKQIILNFDADAAGTQAAERAIGEVADLAYRGEVQLRVLTIPEGKDPDEFLKNHSAQDYQSLLDDAPLWLDWQLENIIRPRDLTKADHLQAAMQQMVALLSNISNSVTRTHYVKHCAELLSGKNAHLVPLWTENLLARVRRSRRPSPQAKDTVSKAFLTSEILVQAESTLLRAYLHFPDYRHSIFTALEERDLDFCIVSYRFLWRKIRELEQKISLRTEPEFFEGDPSASGEALIQAVQDFYSDSPQYWTEIANILRLDEKTRLDIVRTPLVVRAAINCMEMVMCEKRARHFLERWKQADLSTEYEAKLGYWKQYQAERQRILELHQGRCTNYADLAQIPWVQEFETILGGS